jgi:hypothetical protein
MVSTPKIVGLMSCGFLLCLGLSNPAQAGDAASAVEGEKAGKPHTRQADGPRVGGQGSQSDAGLVVEGEKAGKSHTREKGGQRAGGQAYQPAATGEKAATPHTRMPGGTRVGGQGGQ